MFCKNCGNQLGPNSLFCTKCGTKAPAVPQQPAFTAPQPEIPAQPAFTAPQPEIPQQPAFTAPQQPEIPAQPAFIPPQQPEIPAQPAFTAPQQPVYPQQPAFQQPPVYASPTVSAAPGGGNAANVRKIMYFITLIALCILTVGLFCGTITTEKMGRRTENITTWTRLSYIYKRAHGGDTSALKAAKEVYDAYISDLQHIGEMSNAAPYIAEFIAVSTNLIAALLVLVFGIISIISFAKKKEPRAWIMLFIALIAVLLAKLAALAFVIVLKAAYKSLTYPIHYSLILSLILIVAFIAVSLVFKGKAKQDRTPSPGNAYPAGGEYPMQ